MEVSVGMWLRRRGLGVHGFAVVEDRGAGMIRLRYTDGTSERWNESSLGDFWRPNDSPGQGPVPGWMAPGVTIYLNESALEDRMRIGDQRSQGPATILEVREGLVRWAWVGDGARYEVSTAALIARTFRYDPATLPLPTHPSRFDRGEVI
jgi:hypothetical protein